MAAIGDVLDVPEKGWKRYSLNDLLNNFNQIVFAETRGIQIDTTIINGKIKINSKIRVIGKVRNAINIFINADSVLSTKIGTVPTTIVERFPIANLTENEKTLLAEITLGANYFRSDSTYIAIRGNSEYGYEQGVIYFLDIYNDEPEIIKTFELSVSKNQVHFNLLNFEVGQKYTIFSVQNNSLIKICDVETKEFDLNFKYDTEYFFCICLINENQANNISEINKIRTEIEIIAMPYGKTNFWRLNKNLQDEISNFDLVLPNRKFEKFNHEYFLHMKKENQNYAICNKIFANYYSFGIKFNLVLLQGGNLSKIFSNCSSDNIYGWAILNTKDEIFLKYNNYKTKNIKIKTNENIECAIEFNNNNYINFFINKELVLTTKKINDIIYNNECFVKIGDSSQINSSFLINNVTLYNGIINEDLILNPNITSILNKKNKNIINFSDVSEASFYKILRSENKFGKYKEIGIVEKTDE